MGDARGDCGERQMTMAFGRVAQLQFEMACERPPAAFGGSPPHGACPNNPEQVRRSLGTADFRKNLRSFESFWVRLDVFAFESREVCQRSLQSALSGRQFQQIVDST
jgi:hypothetical protein